MAWELFHNPPTSLSPVRVKLRRTRPEHMSSALPPISDRRADIPDRQLRARKRLMHRSKRCRSFDHLVGALLEKPRNVKAKRLGGLEIDHQLELRRLLHR